MGGYFRVDSYTGIGLWCYVKKKHRVNPRIAPQSPVAPPPPPNYGLFYLFPAYGNPGHPPDLTKTQGWLNPNIQGMLWRQTWATIEPTQGVKSYSYMDNLFSLSDGNGKSSSLQVTAGKGAPDWFFSANPAETLFVAGGGVGNTSVPWGPQFLAHWTVIQQEQASMYGNNPKLKYVVISGVGSSSESFLVRPPRPGFPDDEVTANALAVSMGYPDLSTAWQAGTRALIDMYMATWHNQEVVLVSGAPFPTGGEEALLAMYNYGHSTYGTRFGCRPDNLTANSPTPTEPSVGYINICKASHGTGLQFGSPQGRGDPNPPARLNLAFQRGIGYGAHYMEMFTDDADDPRSIPAMQQAMRLFGIIPSPSA